MVKYASTYYCYILKKSANDLFHDVDAILFLIFFIKTYVVGTHLNCIDKSMQVKWVPTTYVSIK